MIELKKAFISDKYRILPMIEDVFEVQQRPISYQKYLKQLFSDLFNNHWAAEEEYIGYYLDVKGEVVGFLGLIFSQRLINGENCKFCNLSTWAVKKEYRQFSLMFLDPISTLKLTHVITALTPNPQAYKIYHKVMKFKILEESIILIPFVLNLGIFSMPSKLSFNIDINALSITQQQIYSDHVHKRIKFATFKYRTQTLLIAFNRIIKKKIPFTEIMYISDGDLFYMNISTIRIHLNIRLKTIALLIDSRFLNNKKVLFSYKMKQGKLYWGDSSMKNSIDNLYSELII